MREPGQVKQKIKQVVFRHLKRYIEEGMKRRPSNCSYNGVLKVPQGQGNRHVVRLCLYKVETPDEWNNVTCDEGMGGCAQAEACPMYDPLHTPAHLKTEFRTMLGIDGSPVEIGWIARHYPDIAALLWVAEMVPPMKEVPPTTNVSDALVLLGREEPDAVPEDPLGGEGDG